MSDSRGVLFLERRPSSVIYSSERTLEAVTPTISGIYSSCTAGWLWLVGILRPTGTTFIVRGNLILDIFLRIGGVEPDGFVRGDPNLRSRYG